MRSFEIQVIEEYEEEHIGISPDNKRVKLYINPDTVQEIFELWDIGLHGKKTYDYFEDKCYGLEVELEEKENIIEMYREQAEERNRRFF